VARVKEVSSREDVAPEERELFDQVAALRGEIRLPYSVFLNHPPLAVRKLHLGSYVRFETGLPKAVSEIAICTAARQLDCDFVWYAHSRAAERAGVSQLTLDAIRTQAEAAGLDATEALTIDLTRQLLVRHRIEDATYRAAVDQWGERGVIELVATIGYYVMSACWMNALEILPPEVSASR
jgi:4-carboxymuconolactone decarboxylase